MVKINYFNLLINKECEEIWPDKQAKRVIAFLNKFDETINVRAENIDFVEYVRNYSKTHPENVD